MAKPSRSRRSIKKPCSRRGANPIDIHVGAGRVRRSGSPVANIIKRAALTSALLIGLAGPAWADFEKGFNAFTRGEYAMAARALRPPAEQGHARAQFVLGYLYQVGQGVPQDFAEAEKWYRKAAEQGNAKAQYNLGVLNHYGWGVPQDHAEAAKWYRKAAQQGNAHAQNSLGVMCWKGHGIAQDYVKAYKWFSLAAVSFAAGVHRDRAVKSRNAMAGKLTPAKLTEAERLTRQWKQQK